MRHENDGAAGPVQGLQDLDDLGRGPRVEVSASPTAFLLRLSGHLLILGLGAQDWPRDSTRRAGGGWSHVALGAGALLVAGLADHTIRTEMQGGGGAGRRATGLDISGSAPPVTIGLSLGLVGGGAALGNGPLARTGRDGLVAMGAAELASAALKVLTGRARPNAGLGPAAAEA